MVPASPARRVAALLRKDLNHLVIFDNIINLKSYMISWGTKVPHSDVPGPHRIAYDGDRRTVTGAVTRDSLVPRRASHGDPAPAAFAAGAGLAGHRDIGRPGPGNGSEPGPGSRRRSAVTVLLSPGPPPRPTRHSHSESVMGGTYSLAVWMT